MFYHKVENSKLNSILDEINKQLRERDKLLKQREEKAIKSLFEKGVSKNDIADCLEVSLDYIDTILNKDPGLKDRNNV